MSKVCQLNSGSLFFICHWVRVSVGPRARDIFICHWVRVSVGPRARDIFISTQKVPKGGDRAEQKIMKLKLKLKKEAKAVSRV